MRVAAFCIGLMLMVFEVFADDHHVDFDHTDFSNVRTFALLEGNVDSPRPELNNPDVVVDYNVSAEDFSELRVTSTEGTPVVDMVKRDSRALIWRGVYRDSERNSAKLAQNLSGDVKKFLNDAADYATSIANRSVETPNAREKARNLAAQLRALDRD